MHPSTRLLRRSLLLTLAGAGLQACGATPPPPAPPRTRTVGPTVADRGSPHYDFDRFELDSADGRRHYRVQLAVPKAPPPAAGHPLLLMLDGNAAFAELTDEMLARMAAGGSPVAIAALGYRTELAVDVVARAFDYTPPVPGENPTWDDAPRQRLGGGADGFLDLLQQAMLPEIRRRVPADPARTTFWGHSYGGLCVLHTLFTRPAAFPRYVAVDPSLWWHDGFILRQEAAARPLPAGRRTELLVMVGRSAAEASASAQSATGARARTRFQAVPPDATWRLVERLGRREGLAVSLREFPGLGHGPVRPASIAPTLALAARPAG